MQNNLRRKFFRVFFFNIKKMSKMTGQNSKNKDFMKIIEKCNNFGKTDSSRSNCLPFVIEGQQVGLIRPDVWQELQSYPNIFRLEKTEIKSNSCDSIVHLENLGDVLERSVKFSDFLKKLRDKNVFHALKGWRDEEYDVRPSYDGPLLMTIERSALGLFGLIAYGTHLNGYTYSEDGSLRMWVAKRSLKKQTYPGKLDNLVAGGLSSGLGIMECMKKECREEADISEDLLEKIIPAGHISYFNENERGLLPECQFVFDLELPRDFVPKNTDGEVDSFQCVSMETLQNLIVSDDFKPNCSLVTLDFLIRKGILTPDSEPHYTELVELLRQPIQQLYRPNQILVDHNIPKLPR